MLFDIVVGCHALVFDESAAFGYLRSQVDPIVPADKAKCLADLLQGRADVMEHRMLPSGHDFGQANIALTKSWFEAFRTRDVLPED